MTTPVKAIFQALAQGDYLELEQFPEWQDKLDATETDEAAAVVEAEFEAWAEDMENWPFEMVVETGEWCGTGDRDTTYVIREKATGKLFAIDVGYQSWSGEEWEYADEKGYEVEEYQELVTKYRPV